MNIQLISFTDRGEGLAGHLAELLGGQASRSVPAGGLKTWTERWFSQVDALIFVGAAGIAVRAIAPYVAAKTSDPAVIVVDESGQFVIPILSGHLGGANALAREIAGKLGAEAVITTATDVNGVFAVDDWARTQGLRVVNPEKIRQVSGGLLRGETVTLYSRWPIRGQTPEGVVLTDSPVSAQVVVDVFSPGSGGLHLVPKLAVLGIGCRKGTAFDILNGAVTEFLSQNRIAPEAIVGLCSIDLKAAEPGLLELAEHRHWWFETYSSEELRALPGSFTPSEFVYGITGVDNVCERSAVKGSGGELIISKQICSGVTLALGVKAPELSWR